MFVVLFCTSAKDHGIAYTLHPSSGQHDMLKGRRRWHVQEVQCLLSGCIAACDRHVELYDLECGA